MEEARVSLVLIALVYITCTKTHFPEMRFIVGIFKRNIYGAGIICLSIIKSRMNYRCHLCRECISLITIKLRAFPLRRLKAVYSVR